MVMNHATQSYRHMLPIGPRYPLLRLMPSQWGSSLHIAVGGAGFYFGSGVPLAVPRQVMTIPSRPFRPVAFIQVRWPRTRIASGYWLPGGTIYYSRERPASAPKPHTAWDVVRGFPLAIVSPPSAFPHGTMGTHRPVQTTHASPDLGSRHVWGLNRGPFAMSPAGRPMLPLDHPCCSRLTRGERLNTICDFTPITHFKSRQCRVLKYCAPVIFIPLNEVCWPHCEPNAFNCLMKFGF